MTLPVKWVTREEMLSSFVARFNDLKGSDKGLPDSDVPGHYKVILNVFGQAVNLADDFEANVVLVQFGSFGF